MTDIQRMIDAMGGAMRQTRSNYHLTLGRAIALLENSDPSLPVQFDWNGASPDRPMSYRGYYDDLAFDWRGEPTTVGEFLQALRSALDTTFTGYKGGNYVMDARTPLWAAQYGTTGRAIIGLVMGFSAVVLKTKDENEAA